LAVDCGTINIWISIQVLQKLPSETETATENLLLYLAWTILTLIMKNILIALLLILAQKGNAQPAQIDLGEKIKGNWVLEKSKSVEELIGLEGKIMLYFKADNTGNFNFTDKDSEPFTWTITRNKITIVYAGNDKICKTFQGDFRIIIRDRKGVEKLEIIRNLVSVSFTG
jgi:lipocalin-like protein